VGAVGSGVTGDSGRLGGVAKSPSCFPKGFTALYRPGYRLQAGASFC